MPRLIIIAFRARVQTVKARRRHPVEQRIDHSVSVIRLYPFKTEILPQNLHKRSVLCSSRREQVQIQSTTLTNYLDVVTFPIRYLSVQVRRIRLEQWMQCKAYPRRRHAFGLPTT